MFWLPMINLLSPNYAKPVYRFLQVPAAEGCVFFNVKEEKTTTYLQRK